MEPGLIWAMIGVIAFLLGFFAIKFSKKDKGRGGTRVFGIRLIYEDGRHTRNMTIKETVIFILVVCGFGGACIWGLLRFFDM